MKISPKRKDEIGNIYGTLKVIGLIGNPAGRLEWTCECQCGCGQTRTVKGSDLRRGRVSSCRTRELSEGEKTKRSTEPRKCSLCKNIKPPSDFSSLTKHYCKTCRGRNSGKLKSNYGITEKHYNEMLEKQNGICAICGNPPPNGKYLHVDHCHASGKVRGLLCHHCNSGLGYFRDDVGIIISAMHYIEDNT